MLPRAGVVVDALVASFFARDFGAEPASSSHMICACCSEGRVDWDESGTPTHGGSQTVWLAAPEAEARQLLDSWAEGGERSWSGLELSA